MVWGDLAPYPAHRPRRGAEAGLVDVVLELLAPHGVADDSLELRVVGAVAKRRPQVGLVAGEEAGPQLAVAGQPDPVAVGAERLRDRVDEADLAASVSEPEHPRRRRRLARERLERVPRLDDRPDLLPGQPGVRCPRAVRVRRP